MNKKHHAPKHVHERVSAKERQCNPQTSAIAHPLCAQLSVGNRDFVRSAVLPGAIHRSSFQCEVQTQFWKTINQNLKAQFKTKYHMPINKKN